MRSLARLLIENLMVGVLVFAVVAVSDQVREPWHSLANTAVAIALVGDAIRLTLSQSRSQLTELSQFLQPCASEAKA